MTADTTDATSFAASMADVAAALEDPAALIADVAAQVATKAGATVPRATGALANSLTMDRGTLDGHPAATLTWGARYAVFVNFGTVHTPARPFATDALAAATTTAEPAMRTWAETALNNAHA